MATNLALDDKLILQAPEAGNHKTKKEAVTAALKSYIAQKKQKITELFGSIEPVSLVVSNEAENL